MFSSDELSQLKQLKQDIRSNRDIAKGVVRATAGRYGFVDIEDGRQIYLSPDKMERVLPGDTVEVEVITNDKNQFEAKLEKLIESPTSFLCGQYKIRGKGHFIAAGENLQRWIFIPPKGRAKSKEGDYITAKLTQHPFKDGRAQANITHNIGSSESPYIERLYTIAKHQLPTSFHKDASKEADTLLEKNITDYTQYQDLKDIPFFTIDSASTRDMDDALSIKKEANGWKLSIAIAAPGIEIAPHSALDKAARKRVQSVYLINHVLPMIPEKLATERYSLKYNEERLALVFSCMISTEGHISEEVFTPAVIKSHGKFSYAQVAALLNNQEYNAPDNLTDIAGFNELLKELHTCSQVLHKYRQENFLVTESKPDFIFHLNEQGKLENIEQAHRNCAHTIVEECMLLTNRYAGEFLAQHNTGLYTRHKGFRDERRTDIETLLSEKLDQNVVQSDILENYISTIKTLQSDNKLRPLLAVQQRFLEGSALCNKPGAHFGLGFTHYATITSPIRRYQDLHNQRAILQILAKQQPEKISDSQLENIQAQAIHNRNAFNFMTQWLICDYIKPKKGEQFTGKISLLTNQGVGVRLIDTGIEGFIAASKEDKVSFNNQRMELQWNNQPVLLDQEVKVVLQGIDSLRNKPVFSFA